MKKRDHTISALIIALVSLLLFIPWTGSASLGSNLIGTIVTPLQALLDGGISNVEELVTNWTYERDLEAGYAALQERVAMLEAENSRLQELAAENAQLKALLGYAEQYPGIDSVQANVIGRDPSNWYSVLTLNVGQLHGVTEDMVVMNADGLIGRVFEVGYNYSKVMCIIDGRSSVSGIVERTRDVGVIDTVLAGPEESTLQMHYLPADSDLRPGDVVKTGGMDRIYPKGITIGTITQISRSGAERMVTLAPSVDFAHIEYVLVVAGDPDRALEEIE